MRSFRVYGHTETGPIRQANEDHILIGRFIKNRGGLGISFDHDDDFLPTYGMVFAVADGIGGETGGAIASKLALTALERQFYSVEKSAQGINPFLEALQAAAGRANETILKVASSKPELSRMGCTLSGICLTPEGYLVFNAGDSRVYRCRDGVLKLLTDDDTITNLAVRAGHLSWQEAEKSEARHTLTNCLGSTSFHLKIETGPELRDNDLILICSDGLHNLVNNDDLEKLLITSGPVEEPVRSLVYRAIQNGGHDNISVIAIRFGEPESSVGARYHEGTTNDG